METSIQIKEEPADYEYEAYEAEVDSIIDIKNEEIFDTET